MAKREAFHIGFSDPCKGCFYLDRKAPDRFTACNSPDGLCPEGFPYGGRSA
jgi:hypothetical protein